MSYEPSPAATVTAVPASCSSLSSRASTASPSRSSRSARHPGARGSDASRSVAFRRVTVSALNTKPPSISPARRLGTGLDSLVEASALELAERVQVARQHAALGRRAPQNEIVDPRLPRRRVRDDAAKPDADRDDPAYRSHLPQPSSCRTHRGDPGTDAVWISRPAAAVARAGVAQAQRRVTVGRQSGCPKAQAPVGTNLVPPEGRTQKHASVMCCVRAGWVDGGKRQIGIARQVDGLGYWQNSHVNRPSSCRLAGT